MVSELILAEESCEIGRYKSCRPLPRDLTQSRVALISKRPERVSFCASEIFGQVEILDALG